MNCGWRADGVLLYAPIPHDLEASSASQSQTIMLYRWFHNCCLSIKETSEIIRQNYSFSDHHLKSMKVCLKIRINICKVDVMFSIISKASFAHLSDFIVCFLCLNVIFLTVCLTLARSFSTVCQKRMCHNKSPHLHLMTKHFSMICTQALVSNFTPVCLSCIIFLLVEYP